MKKKHSWKIVAFLLVIATLMTALPWTVFAEEIKSQGDSKPEIYIKDVKLSYDKISLIAEGYTVLGDNLNAGTGQGEVYLGYKTTTDPAQAIYDMKLMNMKGGFTLTSMQEALAAQESAFASMAVDLGLLVDEFVAAYNEGSVPAQKAYKALNFFRVVDKESELSEENGLGYQIVNGGVAQSTLNEIIMFCDPGIVDSIVKILTMGIQIRGGNWMQQLSEKGPYEDDTIYMEDEEELKRRAEQILTVLEIYSEAYNTMVDSGLMPDDLDEDFNPVYDNSDGTQKKAPVPAEKADTQKLDDNRYKFYKLVADELEKYRYGDDGTTLKDFFCYIADGVSTKEMYPLVSVLSDGEFAALSYGCFLEIATGATATYADFDSYDDVYEALTKEASSVYLYGGVDEVLFDEEAIIGFTDTAQRHMSSTGELNFFEKESSHEKLWEDGKRVSTCIAAAGMAIIGINKLVVGVVGLATILSASAASAAKTGILAGVMKFCTVVSGGKAMLIALAVIALAFAVSYIVAAVDEWLNGKIDWEGNPIPSYLYDVKEVTVSQTSDDGIATEFMKRSVFALYEAVTDLNDEPVDLNMHSKEASQWLVLYASRDKQGEEAKPIKAEDLIVKTGNGETPEGYVPLSRFGEVIAYNLNEWDEDDDVNGIYVFYKQDSAVAVDSGTKYYIYDVYLQQGESDSHCIKLLEAAGYTPINVDLSPALDDGEAVFKDRVYTYLGYKVTTNKENAIRDIRMVYGPSQGEIQYGVATYAECGSNGKVTLYATKYKTAGTPILAGGIICLDQQLYNVPVGYEPVCKMTGGPAVSLNTSSNGRVIAENQARYLYFLPETTFTSGKQYVGDIALFQPDHEVHLDIRLQPAAYDYWYSYNFMVGDTSNMINSVACYPTYNPYRAIYGIKAVLHNEYTNTLKLDGVSYLAWNRISWGYQLDTATMLGEKPYYLSVQHTDPELLKANGAFYLAGNPNSENEYDATLEGMSKVQPLEMSDIMCLSYNKGATSPNGSRAPESFLPVTDLFSNSQNAARITQDLTKYEFEIYTSNKSKEAEKPYVSNIHAIDELTLYRAYGGYDADISFDVINDGMLYAQLASQGATHFNSFKASLRQTDVWDSFIADSYDEINAIRFGYTRTAESKDALRDVFLYFNGFSTDEPPKELYRGSTKYKLLSEIPYNLTGYDSAPKPGVYIYGTTDSKAGNKIIDFEVSGTPFMDGYETVRTMNGRSLVAEIKDYTLKPKLFLSSISDFMTYIYMYIALSKYLNIFDVLYNYFENDSDGKQQNAYFYLHIKREGDSLAKQRPYIEKLHVAYCDGDKATALDTLFDLGAEGYADVDLNKGAGGDYVYVGYSYTSDPKKAIKEIRAYHEEEHPNTLIDDRGRRFTLVSDIDINKGAGGDYIYLYTTTESATDAPISKISVGFEASSGSGAMKWVDGSYVNTATYCTKHWDSSKDSDLNRWAGGKYIYLMYTTVGSSFNGTEKIPNYGKDKLYSRDAFINQSASGKYIGGIYVMDKFTILQEKIAAGELPANSLCDSISTQEVFDRLEKMGATKIIERPIAVNNVSYFLANKNEAFIGYSRTNTKAKAITNLAIKAEVLSLSEPKEKIVVNNRPFSLVAEAAKDVTQLPHAVNLLAVPGLESMPLPRLYLYYSIDGGGNPICDITIDDLPILNDWNTVRSANLIDPFADIYQQAYEQYELAAKDDSDFYDSEIVYSDALYKWMDSVASMFDPENASARPFYIHVKRHTEDSLAKSKPYIGQVFVAEGDSAHEALSKLVAFEPDGFVDVSLNLEAGGKDVYLAYKRVAKSRDALTDIVVYEGKKFEPARRISVGDKSVRFKLVADIDLNVDAGGKYLYLYTTDSSYTGNPITDISVNNAVDSYLKCGVERVTARRADGTAYTDEYINLNKSAGGREIYMVMTRETTEGHTSNGVVTEEITIDATCIEDGCHILVSDCADCGATMEEVDEVFKAHGIHEDDDSDGDHDCDVCDKRDVTEHTMKCYVEEDPDDPDKHTLVLRCTDCDETRPADNAGEIEAASLMGNGSAVAVCSLAGVAILVAITIFIKKRKAKTNKKGDGEI